MDRKTFEKEMAKLLPAVSKEAIAIWNCWAEECVAENQYVNFVEKPREEAIEDWLGAMYASFYFAKEKYGEEAVQKVLELSEAHLCLYPYEIRLAAKAMQEGCSIEDVEYMLHERMLVGDSIQIFTLNDVERAKKKFPAG